VTDLNRVYKEQTALHNRDFTSDGFAWVSSHARKESVIGFLRYGSHPDDVVLLVCNFTPVPRQNYIVGVPCGGQWEEILNSDANFYGGSGMGNFGRLEATSLASHGYSCSLALTLPPLAALILKPATSSGGAL
jgi:1,4-alpha-glucan branching enzyme